MEFHLFIFFCSKYLTMSLDVYKFVPTSIFHERELLQKQLNRPGRARKSNSQRTSNQGVVLLYIIFNVVDLVEGSHEEDGFVLTASSIFLLQDSEFSLAPFVTSIVNPALVKPGFILCHWFRTGDSTAFQTDHGIPFWRHLMQNPEYEKGFSNTMATNSKLVMTDIVSNCKSVLENLRSVVDVGGGTGTSARVIADAFSHLKCIVPDLRNLVAAIPWTNNLEFIGSDMFESIPRADPIILKIEQNVLHNWGDDQSVKILKRCREAISSKKEGGKGMVIEIVVEEDNKLANDL